MRRRDDRAVSIAITHVLTIAVTTIVLAGLLMGASTVLDREQTRSGEQSLETIGERLANELEDVDRLADDSEENTVTVYAEHPETVSGSSYTVEVAEDDDCGELTDGECLRLTAHGGGAVATVPVATETDLDPDSSASGGTMNVSYTGDEITIRSESR